MSVWTSDYWLAKAIQVITMTTLATLCMVVVWLSVIWGIVQVVEAFREWLRLFIMGG